MLVNRCTISLDLVLLRVLLSRISGVKILNLEQGMIILEIFSMIEVITLLLKSVAILSLVGI